MKKVINITLGNIVFALEEEAYNTLSQYLESIKNNLTNTDDGTEIISDIESAIAEKFLVKKSNKKTAITKDDVAAVMVEMGSPADFGNENNEAETQANKENLTSANVTKRLYRDSDDVVIAGVSSGLARYFDIDPVLVRLGFII